MVGFLPAPAGSVENRDHDPDYSTVIATRKGAAIDMVDAKSTRRMTVEGWGLVQVHR